MRTTRLAKKYKSLVDTGGTGNVTELSRETGPYRKVRFTRSTYTSGIDGTTVWNAQIKPVGWSPATPVINNIQATFRL